MKSLSENLDKIAPGIFCMRSYSIRYRMSTPALVTAVIWVY